MKLNSIKLVRFKAFAEADFSIAPLTVLIGPNNAGKSTLLQALALMKQSASAGRFNPSGDIVDLGNSIDNLTHWPQGQAPQPWVLEMQWRDQIPSEQLDLPTYIDLNFTARPDAGGGPQTSACVLVRMPGLRDTLVSAEHPGQGTAELSVLESAPNNSPARTLVQRLPLTQMGPWQFSFQDPSQPVVVSGEFQDSKPEVQLLKLADPYLRAIPVALQSFHYVGPNRAVEQSSFPLGVAGSADPHTASQLLDTLAYDRSLLHAVSRSCERVFHFGIDIDLLPQRQVGLVAVGPDDLRINAVNVGSGLIQLVWILLQLELAQRRSARGDMSFTPAVGIEEPEIHLHPAKQPDMARLLVDYVQRGLQIVCTTQSEHLLMAILQFVAEGQLLPQDLAVYFVDDGHVQRLTVDEQGRLSEGLRGFFEANEEQLLKRLELLMSRG